MEKMRWSIVGTGYIANRFASGLMVVEDGELAAVVSRSQESGDNFGKKYGCTTVYTDYEEMLDQIKPDVVYLGIPNDCHYSYIMKALDRGIHVLSEKPMVDNQVQLDTVYAKAAEKQRFVMEGMWTRCFPAVKQARTWISEGKIGNPLTVKAYFDIKPEPDEWQVWKGGLEHAGGSLRDVGIYSLAMANMVFPEKPQQISSVMQSNGEVDESFRMLMDYGNGRSAQVGGAFNQIGSPEVEIIGTEGRITIGSQFWHPDTVVLTKNNEETEKMEFPYEASGFQFEIMAVQECIRKGELECPDFTWAESRLIGQMIEDARKEWGIIYAADQL